MFRAISPETIGEITPFLNSATGTDLVERRVLVASRQLDPSEQEALLQMEDFRQWMRGRPLGAVFEHEKVEFPSYPYEWAPEMLHAAAGLTLDLAQSCLKEGFSLKDASPYNILFRKSSPIFVDLLSFERRNPRDPIWKPQAQFCRTFLLPLLANKTWDIPLADIFATRRDGMESAEVYRYCTPLQKLLRPYLTLVSLPVWLSRRASGPSIYRNRLADSPEKARFILDSSLNRLRRTLDRVLRCKSSGSFWSHYGESNSYPEAAFKTKEDFFHRFLSESRPGRVLDIGANTGYFSILAARANASVVAIDSDPGCIGVLWQRSQSEDLSILPLVIDFSRPSAATGWRNLECAGFLTRARAMFDAVLMLGLLHHLLVTERIPLDDVLDLASELTTRWLVIEWIEPRDEMFRILARGRDSLYAGLTRSRFEAACGSCFDIVRCAQLPGMNRWIYVLRKL